MRGQRPHHWICDAHSLPPFCATSASPVPQTRSVPRAQRACETEPCNERTLKPTAARRCGAASCSKRAARLPSAVRCNEPVCTGREKIDREAAHLARTSTWLSPAASPTLILDGLAAGPPVGASPLLRGQVGEHFLVLTQVDFFSFRFSRRIWSSPEKSAESGRPRWASGQAAGRCAFAVSPVLLQSRRATSYYGGPIKLCFWK